MSEAFRRTASVLLDVKRMLRSSSESMMSTGLSDRAGVVEEISSDSISAQWSRFSSSWFLRTDSDMPGSVSSCSRRGCTSARMKPR
eukprot:scaffold2113_cov233-Pinguiococcus_pyrenoidosus.AAC.10